MSVSNLRDMELDMRAAEQRVAMIRAQLEEAEEEASELRTEYDMARAQALQREFDALLFSTQHKLLRDIALVTSPGFDVHKLKTADQTLMTLPENERLKLVVDVQFMKYRRAARRRKP